MALTEDRVPFPPSPSAMSDDLAKMTLTEHLSELRNRLVVCIVAVVVMTAVSWFLYNHAVDFMLTPYHDFLRHHLSKDISKGQLVTNGPLEGFTTRLKISAYGGIALSSPVLLWELWRFITPGLHKNEKRYVVPFVSAALVLFAGGVATAVIVFPKALNWLINVSGHGVVPLFSPQKYFTLYVLMCLIFGAVFMYPLIVIFMEISGVVPSARWRKWRRPAIVVICVVAAVITPSSDPFSFMAMAIPMLVFYELAILLGRVLGK
ncbi:MAG: twin-arginine translocase subunit TatC [Actinomycetota bacterium]|nr:twin-arginine translocase subunit TatC [Actinomycetota bacterium]